MFALAIVDESYNLDKLGLKLDWRCSLVMALGAIMELGVDLILLDGH